MRTLFIVFTLVLLSTSLVKSQSQSILLKPEYGKEYYYRFSTAEYVAGESKQKYSLLENEVELQIRCAKVTTENKKMLRVKVLNSIARKPLGKPIELIDYQYPYFKGSYFAQGTRDFYKELMCDIEFLYEFDTETSEVKLYNRTDVLLGIRETLHRKKFNKEDVNFYTEQFNKKGFNEISAYLKNIYNIPNNFEQYFKDEAYELKRTVKDSLSNIDVRKREHGIGLNRLVISYSQDEEILNEFRRIESKNIKERWIHRQDSTSISYRETKVRLLRVKDVSTKSVTVRGKIDGAKYKKLALATLQKPFGTSLSQQGVFVNNDGTFQLEMELKEPQIILLQMGRSAFDTNMKVLMLYAEPGSQIEVNCSVGEIPEGIEFSGDFSGAAQLLLEFSALLPDAPVLNLNSIAINTAKLSYEKFEETYEGFNNFMDSYKSTVDATAHQFIQKELKAKLLCAAYGFLMYANHYENSGIRFAFSNHPKLNKEKLENYVDDFNILDNYNSYGLYSRVLIKYFLGHKVNSVVSVKRMYNPTLQPVVSSYIYRNHSNFPLAPELAKVTLSGHAYYAYLADVIQGEYAALSFKKEQDVEYISGKLEEYTELLLRLCNNKAFSKAVKESISNHLNWDSVEYVPSQKFFTPEGEEQYLKDFLGDKPTVFYVNSNWGAERYFFDELAEKNPDINYVMIVSGNNLQEWVSYIKRAEPIANQLLLVNTHRTLKDVFKDDSKHFIVYDKDGVRYGFANKASQANKLAKASLRAVKKKN